jgi:hypothetical protein
MCSCLLWAMRAHASLGGDSASVQADRDELQGLVTITAQAGYDVWEIKTESGMVVREFARRSGTVFALCWSGPAMPDLRQLLGAHFEAYATALSQLERPGLHRSLRIETGGMVVAGGGHLRAYAGRAFVPAELPPGFSVAELH